MKCITTRFAVTVLTFIIGITAAAIWFGPHKQSADEIISQREYSAHMKMS